MNSFYIVAIANIALGILLLFFGLKFMRLAIGAFGALLGFWLGSVLINLLSWNATVELIILLIIAIVLAVLAFRFYKFLVRASIAITAFSIVYAILTELGMAVIASLTLAILVAVIVFLAIKTFHLIDLLFIFVTASNGAGYILSGLVLLLWPAKTSILAHGQLYALMEQSPLWIIAWVLLAVAGITYQNNNRVAPAEES